MPFPWPRLKTMANLGVSPPSAPPAKRSSRSSRTNRSSSRSTKSVAAASASSSSSAVGPAASTTAIHPNLQELPEQQTHHLSTRHSLSTPLPDPPAYSPPLPDATPHSPNETRPGVLPPPPPRKERTREQRREGRGDRDPRNALVPGSNLLQPRVAVVLGIPRRWHLVLFLCRLLSIAPACYWGLPATAHALTQLGALWLSEMQGLDAGVNRGLLRVLVDRTERRLLFTEIGLAAIWVCASGYLSFFFTDSLMSRWLVTYTPQATVIRLLTISAVNGYVTSWVLYLAGGMYDPRLLLPAWISIATTLTIAYHLTQRKINIRKETSASISVFSIASYISMVLLLLQLQLSRGQGSQHSVPLFDIAQRGWAELGKLAVRVINSTGNGSSSSSSGQRGN